MNKEFWNERYGKEDFAYGRNPNDFLKNQNFNSGTKILCLAEGEGRNGVFLASQGFDVTCVDFSESGIKKINELAKANNVKIETICKDLNDFEL
jgi:2-polyprenyl-3-methyl-5-hydroxy-6-metoxy-1,4-benzoquinol methylase